jgi:hypothetical protein
MINLMKHSLLLLIVANFVLCSIKSSAQAPWRAKLFVHFLDSNNQIVTDTVWFGCDSLGAEGYQEGLDVIDTNLQWNKVYSADDLIKAQYNTDCVNLKTNIREFNTDRFKGITFLFYCIGNPISMSWDTSNFIYQIDSTYRFSSARINSKNGYVYAIDAKEYLICADRYTRINNEYFYDGFEFESDSIRIIPESLIPECKINSAFSLEVKLLMGWHQFTGIDKYYLTNQLITYPNPFNDKLFIESNINQQKYNYSIISLQGIEQLQGTIHADKQEIDTNQLAPGIYFMQLYEDNTLISKTYKIIKL